MENIKELVAFVRKRPQMILIENRIEYLYAYLYSQSFIEYENELNNQLKKMFWKYYLDYSHNYIIYNINQKHNKANNWCEEIKNVGYNDEETMNLFYKIFDRFIIDFYNGQFN